ncbi:MAG: 30S ribosomal protein S2 [Candidatus Undinarchaeales archaeon]|jgi:small subunit ribosomal protein S2|nr:30S ribosomal protein S2 [Candidatus Undinarchaeales archaeon]
MTDEPKIEAEKTSEIQDQDTLVPLDQYLSAGIHIGTQRKLNDMKKFIYKIRPDGLSVLDVSAIDQRIRAVSTLIANYNPEKVMIVCARDVGKPAVKKFCDLTGTTPIITRFMPGSLTNPSYSKYTEPELLFVIDPGADKQALAEALKIGIPVISLCDSNNMTQNIDLILPSNNKGKKSLSMLFWLLSREVMLKQGKIKKAADFKYTVEEFEDFPEEE